MFLQEAATSKPESYRQRMNRFRFIPQSSFVNCFTHAEVFIADTKITKFYSDSKLIAKNKRSGTGIFPNFRIILRTSIP